MSCCVPKLRLPGTQVACDSVKVPTVPLPLRIILPSYALSDFYCEHKYPNQTDLRDGLLGHVRLPEV